METAAPGPEISTVPNEPVRFARARSSRALGCVVYAVAIPVLAAFVALSLGALVFTVGEAVGMSEGVAAAAAIAAAGLSVVGLFAWGIRNYRQESAAEVTVHADRIELRLHGGERVVPYSEVTVIRVREGILSAPAMNLRRASGPWIRIPPDVLPLPSPVLDSTLILDACRRVEQRLRNGETVRVSQSAGRTLGLYLRAVVNFLLAVGCLATIIKIPAGILLALSGVYRIRQASRAWGGGLVLSKVDVRSGGFSSRSLAWEEMSLEKEDVAGLVLKSRRGERLKLPSSADHYLPTLRVIRRRLAVE